MGGQIACVPYEQHTCERLELWRQWLGLGWTWCYTNCAIVSRRPTVYWTDGNPATARIHRDGGAAIEFRDGWKIWALNGVRVPKWLAETRDTAIDAHRFHEVKNADVRREFVHKVGIDRICAACNAKLLQKSTDEMYELLELNVENQPWRYLKMRNPSLSTPDNEVWHVEGVNNRCETVRDALLWRLNGEDGRYSFRPDGDNWYIHGDVLIVPEGATILRPEPKLIA